jgi:hypothetical protein
MITPDNIKPRFVRSLPVKNRFMAEWNQVVIDFLASGDEWLFSTHNDVVYKPETLMHLLSWDKPLVSALIFMRQGPTVPHIWADAEANKYAMRVNDTLEWFANHKEYVGFDPFIMQPCPDDALFEIGFTSTSCTLIHRSVLEAMHKDCGDQYFVQDETGGGEDRRFFELARSAGFPAYVDRSCGCGHLVGDIATSSIDFIVWAQSSTYENTGEQ